MGPDQQVCAYLVKQLRPDTEVVSRTLVNKKKLMADCGEIAALLLRDNCHRVVIVWDLYPPWRQKGEKPCRCEDRKEIFRSLKEAGVMPSNVHLVCIREELEAWLIADNRALAAAISRLTGRVPRIAEVRSPDSVSKPKERLINIFRQHTHRQYQGHNHAIRIVRELESLDLNKIRRSESFTRFALKTTNRQL